MIVDSLVIDPDQASAAMGCNRKAMLDFFAELISREVYLDLYLMLLDEYLCVPTGTTREQLASHTTQSLLSILLQIYLN